jgi:hypothetical protein
VPATVRDKTREVTRGADNAYDRANLLEQFLRTFPIDTKIQPAPANKDSVAYFLFDAGRGYFDYHATAMVVMLRSLGIPARVAVGFVIRPQDRLPDSHMWYRNRTPRLAGGLLRLAGSSSTPRRVSHGRRSPTTRGYPHRRRRPLPEDEVPLDEFLVPTDEAPSALDDLTVDEGSNLAGNILMGLVLFFLGFTLVGGLAFQFAWQRGMAGLDYPNQVWEKTQRLARWARIPVFPQEPRRIVAWSRTCWRSTTCALETAYGGRTRQEAGGMRLRPPDSGPKGVRTADHYIALARLGRWRQQSGVVRGINRSSHWLTNERNVDCSSVLSLST